MTAILLAAGFGSVLALEWFGTLQHHGLGSKLLIAAFQGVMPRTAGFNSVDYAQMDDATLLITDVLMFIGGGSGGTAGGIKVTTFAVLLVVIIAEVRGEKSVTVFDRRIDPRLQRQALTVAAIGIASWSYRPCCFLPVPPSTSTPYCSRSLRPSRPSDCRPGSPPHFRTGGDNCC